MSYFYILQRFYNEIHRKIRLKKAVVLILKSVISLFVVYAVLFSLAGTAAVIYAYKFVKRPLDDIKLLVDTEPAATAYMKQYRKNLQKKGATDTLRHSFVPLDSISKSLQHAVIACEDDGFYFHPGFDVRAIARAFDKNIAHNTLKYGGSTITQQLAKNLFLSGDRTFARKYRELFYTVLLEKYLTKDRILELYLNYAQWGENIFGCEAASQHYYKKSCSNLTIWEAARMAATLAKPATITPHYTKSKFMWKRLRVIADNLYQRNRLDDSGYIRLTGTEPPKPEIDWQDTITVPVEEERDGDTTSSLRF
ncbi:MAG: monofunctional biosynthetic peptidoglycan transglycosylase [Chitinivibrionales bacterium]|nr:monofunctional biosynthetic peptidoglycan transglycosylase [Chitinivibrionales bacterium]